MVRTFLNSDGVKGSSGWWLEIIREKVKNKGSKESVSFIVEAAMAFLVHVE